MSSSWSSTFVFFFKFTLLCLTKKSSLRLFYDDQNGYLTDLYGFPVTNDPYIQEVTLTTSSTTCRNYVSTSLTLDHFF